LVLALLDFAIGLKLFGLSLGYVLLSGWLAVKNKDILSQHIWLFSFFFGFCNIIPDWFLSAHLHTLLYPNEGIFKIGTIGAYMPLLWFIPMYILLYLGLWLKTQIGLNITYIAVGLLSLVLFLPSEHGFKYLNSWQAIHVKYLLGNAAIYVLLTEIMLALAAFWLFQIVQKSSLLAKFIAAASLSVFYLGSLLFWWFLIEN
jgi:hypothetical protein